MLEKIATGAVLGFVTVFLLGAISFLIALFIMWAWNYVMPYLFGLKEIGFWHAFCLNFLAGCLIKSGNSGK